MPPGPHRKLAVFVSFLLVLAGILTALPDDWLIGSPGCHSCHDATKPVDHLLYRPNLMGYNSLCSFAPISTVALLLIAAGILLSTYGFRFIKWGPDYRFIAPSISLALALIAAIPVNTGYDDLLGWHTFYPLFPLSSLFLIAIGIVAFAGYNVCPALAFWRHRCPVLDTSPDVRLSPHRNVWRFLKILATGRLNDTEIQRLYRCTLCNGCLLSWFGKSARRMAVAKGMDIGHLNGIKCSIDAYGNPYGIMPAAKDGAGLDTDKSTILFMGCTARNKASEILFAAESLLKKKGIKYSILEDEACCGSTLFNLGDEASGMAAVDKNIERFKAAGVKRIITVCPGCYSTLKARYKGRNGFDPEVLLALDMLKDMKVDAKGATIHDPCHAKEKRDMVRGMLTGAGDAGGCCGAGGGLMALDVGLAEARARRLVEESDGEVITYCPFCYLNMSRTNAGKVTDIYQYILKSCDGVEREDTAGR